MLMIGRRDQDRVDLLVGEEFAVIGVAARAGVGLAQFFRVGVIHKLLAELDALLTEIANRHNAIVAAGDAGELQHSRHVVPARDAAHANRPNVDAVGRRGGAEDRAGNDSGKSGGKRAAGGGLKKCAAGGNHRNSFAT